MPLNESHQLDSRQERVIFAYEEAICVTDHPTQLGTCHGIQMTRLDEPIHC